MRILTTLLFTLFATFSAFAAGIEFFQGTWEEALAKAKAEEKVIFVDAYAVWCGPCKMMAKNVFPKEEVGTFYNKHFISMQIDMERGMGLEFAKKYPVRAYPTLFYIDAKGEVVHKAVGAQREKSLISIGKRVLGMVDKSQDYAKEYEGGNREPELIYKYVRALNKAGKSSLKISNEYLRAQENLKTPFNLQFILEATVQADSKIFEWLIEYRDQIAALTSEEEVNQRIYEACRVTAQKAVEFRSEFLVEEAIDKMRAHYPERLPAFEAESWMQFYLATDDAKSYVKEAKKYAKREIDDDAKELQNLVTEIVENFDDDDKAMKLAEDLAERAMEVGQNSLYHLIYADVLYRNGEKSEAVAVAREALELAREEGPSAVRTAQRMLQKMEG